MSEVEETKLPVPTLTYTYKKSSFFRVVRVDGAWGNISPRGDIVMSLFNERTPFPDSETFNIEDGKMSLTQQERSTKGLFREMEVALNMDPLTAFTIANWLLDKVKTVEEQLGVTFSKNANGSVEVTTPEKSAS